MNCSIVKKSDFFSLYFTTTIESHFLRFIFEDLINLLKKKINSATSHNNKSPLRFNLQFLIYD